jgi:uncharacterized membrane protein
VTTSASSTTRSGPSTVGLLGVAFVILKLTGTIGWGWAWVLLPFYAGFLIIAAILLLVLLLKIVVSVVDARQRKKRRKAYEARTGQLPRKRP